MRIFNKKHVFVLILLMLCIFTVTSVGASDLNATDDVITSDDIVNNVNAADLYDEDMLTFNNVNDDDIKNLSVCGESEILVDSYSPESFTDIQACIDKANAGDTITLMGTYLASSNDTTINVNKQLTFVGKRDAIIDGNHNLRLFAVSATGVIFKDITFKNGITSSGNNAGAITGGSAINCTFINNSGRIGGAIYGTSAINCSFMSNSASIYGGAMHGGSATNCIFINNFANSNGGAMDGGSAMNCTFMNNSARMYGGAVYGGSAVNCSFVNNSVSSSNSRGGAVYGGSAVYCSFVNNSAFGSDGRGGAYFGGSAINCSFVGNYANKGGAISSDDGDFINCSFFDNSANDAGAIYSRLKGSVVNCNFTNNHANRYGAMYGGSKSCTMNCIFINNSASSVCGAIYCDSTNCIFINNSAGTGGVIHGSGTRYSTNCIFINNSANKGGAVSSLGFAINCIFIGNSANDGGALYDCRQQSINCTFINNSANNNGGAVHSSEVVSSLFINNSAGSTGGAIYSVKGIVDNCIFVNNSAKVSSSNIFITGLNNGIKVNNSQFINCSSLDAILVLNNVNGIFINNCSFINCSSDNSGYICYLKSGDNLTISGCTIKNCNFGENNDYFGFYSDSVNCTLLDGVFDEPPSGMICYYNSLLTVADLSVSKGERGILLVNLSDVRGSLFNKTVILTINGNNYTNITDFDGLTTFEVTDYLSESGIYTISISFNGENVNFPVSKNVTFIIRYDSFLNSNNLSIVLGNDGYIIANISDINGVLSNKTIVFTLKGNNYTNISNDFGIASINVKDILTESGIYVVDVNFLGDNVNNPISTVSTVILRYDSILEVNNISIVLGDDGIVVARLYDSRGPLINRDIIFTINGNDYTNRTNSEGVGKLNVKGILTKSGIYAVTINYNGDNVNNPISNTSTVIVRYDSSLTANDLSVFITEDGILTASLSDSNGPLVNKDVIFTINGNNYINKTNSNGLTTFNVKNYLTSAGSYTVYINFEGNYYNNPISTTANVVINKYDSIMSVNNLSIIQGENGILTAILSNQNGPLTNKIVTFNLNGKKRSNTTNSDGVSSINIKNDLIIVGEYSINVSFAGDDYNNPISTNANVVIRYDSILTVNDLSFKLNDDGILIANLSTRDGQQANKIISFTINNVKYTNTTSSKGIATFNVKNYLTQSGFYTIPISFEGDKFNGPASASSNIIVKYDSTLKVDEISAYITQDAIISAKLYDSRGVLKNKNIVFTINGNSYSSTTNANGVATFNVKNYLTESGTYTIGVLFNGDNENNPVSTNVGVTINKYDSTISAEGISVYIGTDGILYATLRDARGVISNKDLTFTVNGNNYINRTNANGIATFNVKNYLTQANTYTVKVSFAGDKYDNPTSANVNVVINKYTPTLTVNDLSIKKGEDGIISAILSDSRGALKDKTIKFTINGRTYTNTTNVQGIASINVKNYLTSSGIYNVGVSFAGDDYDKSVSKNSRVVVRYDSVINVDNISMALGEDGKLIARLSDSRGVLSNKNVVFTVNNKRNTITTDSSGLASLPIKGLLTSSGEYIVNIAFAGDNENNPISTKASVIIRYDSTISVGDISCILGEDGILVVSLSDSRGVLSNKAVTFTINGNDYVNTTNDGGVATFNVKDCYSEYGSYIITASFAGDNFNNPVSANANVIINIYEGILSITQNGKYYHDTNLTFRLVNSKTNVGIPYTKIYATFSDGTDASVITDENGVANYNLHSFVPGSYEVTASASMQNVKIDSVKLDNLVISSYVGSIEISQAEDCRLLNLKLYDPSTGELFKDFTITLHFEQNNKYVDVKTNEEGLANYSMPFTPGNYSVEAYVDGEYMEFSTARLDNIVINNNINSVVSFVPEILTFDYLGSGKIGLYLSGCTVKLSDISVINHPEAIISLNNNEITVSGLDAGVYTLKVLSDPFTNYNSVTRTTNIVVNKIDSTLILNPTSFDYGKSGSVEFNVDGCQIIKDNIRILNHPEAVISLSGNKITVSNLSAGTYTLQVTSSPDDNHNAVTVNTTITVNRVDSSINLTPISFDYGQTGSSNVNVVGGSVLRSNIQVLNHPNANINIYDNIISVSGLDAGSYTLQVTTTPDDNHKAVTGTTSITVGKVDSSLNITKAIVFDYGSSDSTSIEFSGCSINSNNIKILNHPEATVVFSGKVISVSGLDAGSYTLQVTTTPDNNHKSVTKTIGVTVNEIASDVIFVNRPLSFDYGGSDSTALVLTGCSVDLDNIKVIGAQANIALKNNEITVSGLDAGSYTLQVTTTPNKNYKSVTKTINVIVNKIDSTIGFSETGLVFDQGDSASVKITVGGGSVGKIGVDNHPEAIITNNGDEFTISNLNYGSYMLTVVSNPDKNHNAVSKSLDITVNKMLSNVTFGGDIVFDYGGSGSTWIKVIGGGVSPSDISIVGHSEADITMTSNNIIFVSNLNVGVYTLKVITSPDENHRSVEATVPVIVNKANSTVEFNDISFDYGSSGSTSVSVDGGKLLLSDIGVIGQSDAKITYNGKSITVSDLDAGSYTLRVTTTPDSNHKAVNATVNVYVNKVDSVLVLSDDVVFDYGGSGSTVITAGGDDVSLSGISVVGEENAKISLNNYKITVSNLDAGRYTLRVTTSPDKNHNPITRNVDIVVNKVDSVIGLTNAVIFDYGGFGSTNVTVIGGDIKYSGISVDDYDNAKISLNGREITVSNLDAGTYILRVVTSPDKNHNSVTGTTSVIVNKIDSELSFKNNVVFDYGSSGSTGVIMSGCSVERSGISVINHNEAVISVVGDTIAVSNLAVGNYTLRVVSTPDRNHKAVTKTAEITVAKSDSSVGFTNDMSFDYGSSGTTTLILEGCSVDVNDIKVVGFDALIEINDNNMVTVSGLDVGFYNLSVTSTPDSNHKSVTRFVGVTVKKVDSNVEFDKKELSFVYGGSGSVGVNVIDGSLSKDNIHILNHPEAKIQLNGNVVTVSGLNAGSYTLTVTSIGDKNHNDFTNSIDVIVTKASSSINFTNDVVFDYGGSGSVGVNVAGGTLSEGNIRVLNHGEAEIHLKDGSIIVSGLDVGKYTLSVTSSPDSNHVAVTKTVGITVNRVDSSIDFDSNLISYDYGGSGSVGVNVVGGSISISGVIIVGSEVKPTYKDNKIAVSGLDVGDYTLKVTTTPDSNHNSVSGTINVSVSKSKSKIDYTGDIVFDYGSVGTTTLILDGCTVKESDCYVEGHSEAVVKINDKNVISVSKLTVGKYTLHLSSIPDKNHEPVNATINIVVNKIDSKVSFSKNAISFKYAKSGSVVLTLEGCSVKLEDISVVGQKAKITLKDNTVGVSNLAVGTYTLKVTTTPDKVHNSVDGEIKITVTKNTAKIKVNKQTFAYKKAGKWAITLKDSSGKSISKVKVTLKVYTGKKFKPYTSTATNSNGVAYFNLI
ncbi:MAG: Ig-like domain-containing protein, partial [Methanobrevibacter sp.]|nr:Ig-like domain-containing protein [Methanobrevibacter sp.]